LRAEYFQENKRLILGLEESRIEVESLEGSERKIVESWRPRMVVI